MKVSMNFNWPPSEDSAFIELHAPNLEDREKEFRIGVMSPESPKIIAWYGKGWFSSSEEILPIRFTVRKTDTVVVERRRKSSGHTDYQNQWKIAHEWPLEAQGPTMVRSSWTF